VSRDSYHQVVGLLLGQPTCIDSAAFEEHERSFNTCSFIAIEISLTLGQMKRIGSGDFVYVAAAVVINVLRCRNGRLQCIFVANSGKPTKALDWSS
jgi:hypothetical protein